MMSYGTGWVQLYRRSIDHPLFKKPLIWHYWQYCLLKANHTDKKIIFNGSEIKVDRGSFITGLHQASAETGLSVQNIRTALRTLLNLGMLEKSTGKSTNKFTYLTVCNYDDFQVKNTELNNQTNKQPTSNQQATNKQPTTNNNDNHENNEKNKERKKPIVKPTEVTDQTWSDFISHRKAKKAPVTQTALGRIQSEAEKAGVPLEDALSELVARGWTGFKADWVKNKTWGGNVGTSLLERNMDILMPYYQEDSENE